MELPWRTAVPFCTRQVGYAQNDIISLLNETVATISAHRFLFGSKDGFESWFCKNKKKNIKKSSSAD